MAIYLDEIISPGAGRAMLDLRRHEYARRTILFVDQQEPKMRGNKSDKELYDFILHAYERSNDLGYTYERDHLSYLIASYYIGVDFPSDPQFLHLLSDLQWFDAGVPSMPTARNMLEAHMQGAIEYFRIEARTLAHLRLIVNMRESWTQPRVQYFVRKSWPDLTRKLPDEVVLAKINHSYQRIGRENLSASDKVLYVVLSFALGCAFGYDRRFPKVTKTILDRGEPDEKRVRFWESIRDEAQFILVGVG